MKITKILGSLVGVFVFAGFANADDADMLIDLDKQWGESDGAESLAPLLSDKLLAIDGGGLGGKAEMLSTADEDALEAGTYDAGDYKVRFLSDDIAIMVHSTGAPEPHWSLHVWQKLDGEWRVAATASVPTQE